MFTSAPCSTAGASRDEAALELAAMATQPCSHNVARAGGDPRQMLELAAQLQILKDAANTRVKRAINFNASDNGLKDLIMGSVQAPRSEGRVCSDNGITDDCRNDASVSV